MKKLVAIIVATTAILMSRTTAFASDGVLDTTWGGTGVVISSHTNPSAAYAIANYPDDRVLVVGALDSTNNEKRILITRYLSDGTLDSSCNNSGEFIDTAKDAITSDVVVLSDGSFVVAGTMQISSKSTLFLAKFTSTCTIDGSFGNSGFATYMAGDSTAGTALAVQSNGSIVVAGYEYLTVSDGGAQRILVVRFTPSGDLDSFGTNGQFLSSINEQGQAQDIVIDSTGRIIFVGSIDGTVADDAVIVGRLTSNGQLDPYFAVQGYFIDELSGDPRLNAIAIRPNGNLVAVGTYGGPLPSIQQSPIVVCLTQIGSFDSDCGVNGWAYLPTANSDVYADDVLVTSDNKILLSGMINPTNPQPIVMRLNHNGTPDNSFAASGTWQGTSLIGRMYSVTIQSDGRILAAGQLDAQGTMSVGVVRLANTVVVTTTTTTTTIAPLVTTSTTIPTTTIAPLATTTTIAPEQLPATGSRFDSLTMALLLTVLGSIVIAARLRTSH